jgi:predicted NACHT family NTPase
MSGEQLSKEVKAFCNEIGSTLRALEEGTPWAKKAELYIGLLKEAVRKDMKEQDSSMVLWDYFIERRARIHNLTAKSNFKLHGHTLERKEMYPTFVNLDGTSGATIVNTLPPFPTNRKSWGECLDQQREKSTNCSSGC